MGKTNGSVLPRRGISSLWLISAIATLLAPGEQLAPDAPRMQVPPPRAGVKRQNCGPYSTKREDARRERQRARLPLHEVVRLVRLDAIREERATVDVEPELHRAQQAT